MRFRCFNWPGAMLIGRRKHAFNLRAGINLVASEVRSRWQFDGRLAEAHGLDHVDAEGELNYLESDQ